MKRKILRILLAIFTLLLSNVTTAHEMSMAEMQLREMSRGEFLWQWAAGEKRPPDEDLTPVWPEGCTADSNVLRCGEAGLQGALSIEGVGQRYSAATGEGFLARWPVPGLYPDVGPADGAIIRIGRRPARLKEIALAYTVLGIEHILTGIDHQLFVIGLLFLVGFNRRLFWTITAFTVAHSVTLALSALGWLELRSAPVEATIALSIVLVAGEALHQQQTLARRWPALVAFLFGLVHGLGFAGALREIGLPENHLLAALLTFNIGVEIGQLLIVTAAWLLWRLVSHWPKVALARTAVLYGIGSVAAYWSWERAVAIFN